MKTTQRRCHGLILASGVLALLWGEGAIAAENPNDPRGVMVEEVRNEQPQFLVRLAVDHADGIYRGGEEMQVGVRSERDGYLYLFYCDAARNVSCLFPNRVQTDNRIAANTNIIVPAREASFKLRVGPPYGREVLQAVVSLEPLKVRGLEWEVLTRGDRTALSLAKIKEVFATVKDQPAHWAEHHLEILTVDPGTTMPTAQRRRVGVFIGISEYLDPKIKRLRASHKDAENLAQLMGKYGHLDTALVLLNRQATLQNIAEVLCKRLPALTRPGDLVVLYWSGHGAAVPRSADRQNGYCHCLVPYDAQTRDFRTLLNDDLLARWIQELDGRQVVLILDSCHSGGQHQLGKGISAAVPADKGVDFFSRVLGHMKAINQKEVAVFASSTSRQISWERSEGDGGVMTYYLGEALTGNRGAITLPQAFDYVRERVPAYVERAHPGQTQTPVLYDRTTPPVFLRP
jgi:hypothetical protein